MNFEKIERIAIGVRNLDEAKKRFEDLLGITFDEPLQDDVLKMKAVYSTSGLELVAGTEPGTIIDKFVETRGEGIFCIVLKVKDIEETAKVLETKGLRRVGSLKFGGLKELAFHPREAHGVQIVLSAYEENHPATIAALRKNI